MRSSHTRQITAQGCALWLTWVPIPLLTVGRKRLTKAGLDSATIVSLICLLQGAIGLLALTAARGEVPIPTSRFWPHALASASLSAITATLLTRAYSTSEFSLIAPFNAALPVFQFLMTTFVLRDEATLPPRKVGGVFVVCCCSFWLARAGRARGETDAPLLPPGARLVLLCCAIWSVITKFDQEATKAVSQPAATSPPN
jgi:drug/metabolite transporter (DMT)-like permease